MRVAGLGSVIVVPVASVAETVLCVVLAADDSAVGCAAFADAGALVGRDAVATGALVATGTPVGNAVGALPQAASSSRAKVEHTNLEKRRFIPTPSFFSMYPVDVALHLIDN